MVPSALRALVEAFLSGSLGRDELRNGVEDAKRALTSQSGKVVGLLRGLAFELGGADSEFGLLRSAPAGDAVLVGLGRELLESLPAMDTIPNRASVLTQLDRHGHRIARQFGLALLGVSGSVARGEATLFSDVDVVVQWVEKPSGFEALGRLENCRRELMVSLGRSVDLLTLEDLKPHVRERIMEDLIPLPSAAHAS